MPTALTCTRGPVHAAQVAVVWLGIVVAGNGAWSAEVGSAASQSSPGPAVEAVLQPVIEPGGLDAALQCRDRHGRDIPLMRVGNLGDVGKAWYVNRVPVIAMDPHIANRLPDKLVRFFFNHECAHHVLGHWYLASNDKENDADCWAVTRERDRGQLSREEIVGFAPFLAQSRGTPWGHLPGPERVRHMLFCFDKPLGG